MTKPNPPGPGVHEEPQAFADDRAREAALDELRKLLAEGEASGPAQPFDVEEFLAECRRERKLRGG